MVSAQQLNQLAPCRCKLKGHTNPIGGSPQADRVVVIPYVGCGAKSLAMIDGD